MNRSLARRSWIVACGLGLAACSDGFFHDPAEDSAAGRIAIRALQVDDGAEAAFDKADNLAIRVIDEASGRTLFDEPRTIDAGGGPLEVRLDVDLDGRDRDAVLQVAVRRGSDDLFVGASAFQLVAGRESAVSLSLDPVVAGLDLPPIPSFTTYGQVVPLGGVVVFATGDPIPGREVVWESLTPEVLTVRQRDGGGYEAVALADGEGSLQAGFESTVETVPAPVRAVVVSAELLPSSLTLGPGETAGLQVFHFDAGDNPVPGRTSDWESSDPSVVTVTDEGIVTAVGLGTADVTATHEGVTARAAATVRDPGPAIGSVSSQGVTANGATLAGDIDPKGLLTTVWFELGLQPDLSDGALTAPTTVTGSAPVPVLRSVTDLLPGTTYYFRVIAENALGRTVSDIFTFTTLVAPDAPSGLTAIRTQSLAIQLDWTDNSNDETRFEIGRQRSGAWSALGSVGPDVTRYVDANPPVDTEAYRVRACNANGCSAWSDPAVAPLIGDPSVPGPTVTTLPARNTGLGTAALEAQVDAKGRTTSVQFEYGTDPALAQPSRSPVTTVSGSLVGMVSTPVTGLLPGGTYYVRAVATNAGGRAVGSTVSFRALALPSAPTGLTTTDNGPAGVSLSWTDNSVDEDRFELERESIPTGLTQPFATGAGQASYVDVTPPAGDLRYRVRACNVAGCSAFTAWVVVQRVAPPGPLVITLPAQAIVPDGADVRAFVDPKGAATTVDFLIGTDPTLATTVQTPSVAVAASDPAGEVLWSATGLQPATHYYVRAVATNAQGQQQGSIVSFTTLPAPPPPAAPSGLMVTPSGAAGLQVDWTDNSSDESTFELERRLQGSGSPTVIPLAADVVQYADGAPPVGLVEYRVRACNLGGCSAWTSPAQAYFGLAPAVTLAPIANIGLLAADASAQVTPFQAATTVVFRISTDAGFATSTVVPAAPLDAGSGTLPVSVGSPLTGLDDGSTYYVRAEATNLWGTTLSNVEVFTTLQGGGG